MVIFKNSIWLAYLNVNQYYEKKLPKEKQTISIVNNKIPFDYAGSTELSN